MEMSDGKLLAIIIVLEVATIMLLLVISCELRGSVEREHNSQHEIEMDNLEPVFVAWCYNHDGMNFKYITQGRQLRCEDGTGDHVRFYDVNMTFESAIDCESPRCNATLANGTLVKQWDY